MSGLSKLVHYYMNGDRAITLHTLTSLIFSATMIETYTSVVVCK